MKIKARFTTAVSFFEKVSSYEPGEGNTTSWALYTEGAMCVFPCEWRGKWIAGRNRNETYLADAEGITERATIRMPYIPRLYDKLRSGAVVVIKGADPKAIVNGEPDPNNLNTYEVFGGVDNIYEENQYMEFHLTRYEVNG